MGDRQPAARAFGASPERLNHRLVGATIMVTAAENELLTRIGPGTRIGNRLRRYWHPIGAVEELEGAFTKRVRLLGEDLVLYRDRS